jgi:tetratricopeptide (TPR) repeat protein
MKILSRRSIWLALYLLASLVNVRAQQEADGDAALMRFNLGEALAAYRAVHKLAPDNYEATWKLARALADKSTLTKDRNEQKQDCVEAEQLARAAVKLKPDDSKGHAYLAVAVGKLALYEGGKRKVELGNEVKREAQRAIQLNDKEDLAYHVLGVWNREMAELNWVLRKFAEMLYGKFPSSSLDTAVQDLERARELAPTVVPHRVELGVTLADMRRWQEANDVLEKALTMPKAWVTDEYYWDIAHQTLPRVKAHLK